MLIIWKLDLDGPSVTSFLPAPQMTLMKAFHFMRCSYSQISEQTSLLICEIVLCCNSSIKIIFWLPGNGNWRQNKEYSVSDLQNMKRGI